VRGCPSVSLFFGLNAVARRTQRLTLGQFLLQSFWTTMTRPPFPVTASADFFPQVVVGFNRVRAATVGTCLVLFPVEPDLPALALQSLWIRIRAIRNVPTVLTPGRGLCAAGVPRYKLIFGLGPQALFTQSMPVRDGLFGGQAFALSLKFSANGPAGWTLLVFGRVHALASFMTAFLGCHN